jgi:hypothetical protein
MTEDPTATITLNRTGALRLVLLRVLQTVTVGHAMLLFAQPVLAGSILDGSDSAPDTHADVAGVIIFAVMLMTPLAVLLWRPYRWPLWPVGACLAFFAVEVMQVAAGQSGTLTVHLPLGVCTLIAAIAFAWWTVQSGPSRFPGPAPRRRGD